MVEIVFPAAILQPPFFDPNADPAVNYGGIGAVIGHEISHHFDDQGAKYDEQRQSDRLVDARRRARLSRRASTSLVQQYDAYEPLPGLHVKGKLTLGENIADLAGLTVAYDAYIASLGGKEAPVIDGMTGDQRFYLGWAQVWRRNYREANLRQRLLTDPHSPSGAARPDRPQPRPLVPGLQRAAGPEAVPRAGRARAHLVGGPNRMLHQELPPIASRPLDGGGRWLLPALGGAAVLSLAALWLLFGPVPALVLAGLAAAGAIAARSALRRPAKRRAAPASAGVGPGLCAWSERRSPCARSRPRSLDGRRACWPPTRPIASASRPCLRSSLPADEESDAVAAGRSLDGLARWRRLRCGRRDAGRHAAGRGPARGLAQRHAAVALPEPPSAGSAGARRSRAFRA